MWLPLTRSRIYKNNKIDDEWKEKCKKKKTRKKATRENFHHTIKRMHEHKVFTIRLSLTSEWSKENDEKQQQQSKCAITVTADIFFVIIC